MKLKIILLVLAGMFMMVSCNEDIVPVDDNTSDNEQNDQYTDDEDMSDDDLDNEDIDWPLYLQGYETSIQYVSEGGD